MHSRLNSTESGSFFFQPAQLHLESTDLLVQFRNQGVLLLGVVAATVREQLRRALTMAGLDSLQSRLDDWAGQHGMNLSGGEQQRLAIARMILQDAPVIVLDEATANLDAVTEQALLDTLDRASQGRTVLAITHRLHRMERYDEIVVLYEGRIKGELDARTASEESILATAHR